VLIDGLVACGVPQVVVPASARWRVVVLVHLPLGLALPSPDSPSPVRPNAAAHAERDVLGAAAAVVTTSEWTRQWLTEAYDLGPNHIHVATPGVDPGPATNGSPAGGALLCVAAVVPAKGHAELLEALATVRDLRWHLVCVGSLDLAPDHVARLRAQCVETGLADRVTFAGPLVGDDLARTYAASDLLVLASRFETFGLVVVESLARAVPVLATAVGGIAEALGGGTDGVPGLVVPAADPVALAAALRSWLTDPALRGLLRAAALERRRTLAPWSTTGALVSQVLTEVAA
jgi:glycosyltransferase involved in cell wall biosynthesis